ncbi:hypothetical protein [Sandaracinobacter sp.]|uniref:hypothetical protein n=1 Tax=Sandaracinobacter sp. TaxID=2487581 RepID=UPI0035B36407
MPADGGIMTQQSTAAADVEPAWPDWSEFAESYAAQVRRYASPTGEDLLGECRRLAALCAAETPAPAPPWLAQTPATRAAKAWFGKALDEIAARCLGFDIEQATGEGATATRRPLHLFSGTAWLLELRFPVGRAVRTCLFIVDLQAPDGQTIMPIDGTSGCFHARADQYHPQPHADTAVRFGHLADYCRAFCSCLKGEMDGTIAFFAPIECRSDLERVAIGPIPPDAADAIGPLLRHTPAAGVELPQGQTHVFSLRMLYGTELSAVLIAVTLVPPGRPDSGVSLTMAADRREHQLPVVPIAPDRLTFAYFPLRKVGR